MLTYDEFNYGLEAKRINPEDNHADNENKTKWRLITDHNELTPEEKEKLAQFQIAHSDYDKWALHRHKEDGTLHIAGYKLKENGNWQRVENFVHKETPSLRKGRVAGTLLGIGGAAALGYHYLKGRGKKAVVAVKKANKEWSTGKKAAVGAAGAAGLGAVGYGGYRMTHDDD